MVDLNVLCSGEPGAWGRDLAAGSADMPLNAHWVLRDEPLYLTSLMTLKLMPLLLHFLMLRSEDETFVKVPRELYEIASKTGFLLVE